MEAILTDAQGRPMPRPERADYPDAISWMRAFWAWKDRVAEVANRGFAEGFRAASRRA